MRDRRYWISVGIGALLLLLALIATSVAQKYADEAPGNSVGDLVLDHLPNFPWPKILVGFLVWGSLGLGVAALVVGVANPKYLPAGLKTIGLMYLIRAIFIAVTHLKVHTDKLSLENYSEIEKTLYGSNDLFFSGHTALPFIAALIFWNIKPLRYTFLCASAIFGIAILLAKSHYTIDVLAAPFMAYAIYQLARVLFRKDFAYQEKN